MQTLLNHSVLLIFLATLGVVGYREYRRYLQRTGISPQELRLLVSTRLNEMSSSLLQKLAITIIATVIISVVSFREAFQNDVFHTVFLTLLLLKPITDRLNRILE